MNMGSLFAGIGGFDLAFQNAGVDTVWQVEIDKQCRQVLRKHFRARLKTDVKEVGSKQLKAVDIITGGFPCQDLSIAGRRAGLDGERSGLWFEFARIVRELSPQWVVIENVPGLLSSAEGGDMETIIRTLAEWGYCVAWRCLDAQYSGLAQRRNRVYIVASLGDGRSAQVLFESEGGAWNPAPSREAGQGIAETLDAKSASSNRGSQANETDFIVAPPLTASNDPSRSPQSSEVTNQLAAVAYAFSHVDNGRDVQAVAYPDPAYSVQGKGSKFGSGRHNQDTFVWHNKQLVGVRRLTPVECERLQGFPDNWTEGHSDSARYRMLGNAVPVPVVEWIARRIVEASG